jgi:hypothetical protein
MRFFVSAIIAVSLSACGILPANPEVDPEFRIIYSGFLADAAKYGRDLNLDGLVIRMAEPGMMESTIQGSAAGKTVEINPDRWSAFRATSAGNADREVLIYHELGHALLGLSHDDPVQIMKVGLLTAYYARNREEYIRELFEFKKSGSVSPSTCEKL